MRPGQLGPKLPTARATWTRRSGWDLRLRTEPVPMALAQWVVQLSARRHCSWSAKLLRRPKCKGFINPSIARFWATPTLGSKDGMCTVCTPAMMCLCYLVFGPVVVACCSYSKGSKSRRGMQLLHLQAQALEDRRWALGSEDFIWHCSDEIFQADVGRKHQTMAGKSRGSQKRQGLWLGWSDRFCDPQVHDNLWDPMGICHQIWANNMGMPWPCK